jgi:hypothetical protein
MKEPMENSAREWKWDDSLENSQDFIDAAVLLPDEEALLVDETENPATLTPDPVTDQSQFTKLRRRIEERLDSKRIALEYDYD